MEEDLTNRLDQLEQKLEKIHSSVLWIKKYLLVQAALSVFMILLPIIIAAIIVPMVLSAMQSFMPSQIFNGSFLQ